MPFIIRTTRHLQRHLVAYLALFTALRWYLARGGEFTRPKNSVGTAQVINGSLLKKDFKAGQLVRGPEGPSGEPGQMGLPEREAQAGPAGRQERPARPGPAWTGLTYLRDFRGYRIARGHTEGGYRRLSRWNGGDRRWGVC